MAKFRYKKEVNKILQERQKDIKKFLDKAIVICQTKLVEHAIATRMFISDDIQNLYRPFDGRLLAPNVCRKCIREYSILDSETGECQKCYDENNLPQEIFEWWLVAPWFSTRLLIEGQPIIDTEDGIWWGRCTTGQDLSLDYVIQKIYDDIKYKE